jgi:Tfp pilus assembly PilM family ATPase
VRTRRTQTLPLGIDFGSQRIRVALSERDRAGHVQLVAVAAYDAGDDPVSSLSRALIDLRSRERRCVFGLTRPNGVLHVLTLPKMSRGERLRAARFESSRVLAFPLSEAQISVYATEHDQRWIVGVARAAGVAACIDAARRLNLQPLAIDDVAFALGRVYPEADGIIDIGGSETRVMIFSKPVPLVTALPFGGDSLTEAIRLSLGIDRIAAEERKRSIGLAGAGDSERDALVGAIAEIIASARVGGFGAVRHMTMAGNGSRVPGLSEAIGIATDCHITPAMLDAGVSRTLPPDVLRAAAPDWSVAFGLSLWGLPA